MQIEEEQVPVSEKRQVVIPVMVEISDLNLKKPFVYYALEDLQYNLDAFLLTTGLSLACSKCRPTDFAAWAAQSLDTSSRQNRQPACCQFTFILEQDSQLVPDAFKGDQTQSFLDLRQVVNPAEHLTSECPRLKFVKLDSGQPNTPQPTASLIKNENQLEVEKLPRWPPTEQS